MQGQFLLDNTSDDDTLLIFSGPETDSNSETFLNGALSVLQKTGIERELYGGMDYINSVATWILKMPLLLYKT